MTESAESAESANVLACRCSILWHDSEAVLSLIWVGIASKNEYSLIEDGKPDSNPSAAPSSSAESTDATETTPKSDSGKTARKSRESMWVMPLRCSAVFLARGLPLLFVGIYILMLDNGGGYFTGCGELAPQYYD